ncbi:RDD family protein [Streptomyces violaceorubidus]|uniref:RDD family protein n=1 Tax=Streptomyces violaceorubidus TaxID=284042 RepID=UPI0004C20583|nr:RDD family protein [Streptomyces violaceorubidus]
MSAPTPAPGDDRPREGYYPDPSIPGYVRYWNGASWVAGTSRPAPKDGEPLAPPPGARASVEETGPHFFDEDPVEEPPPAAASQHASRPESAGAWGADRSGPSGGSADAPGQSVAWPGPARGADPRVPHARQTAPPADGGADAGQQGGAAASSGGEAAEEDEAGNTFVFRRPATGRQSASAPAPAAAEDEGTMTFRAVTPRTGPQPGGPGSGSGPGSGPGFGAGKAAADRAAAAQAPQTPAAPRVPHQAPPQPSQPQPQPAAPAPLAAGGPGGGQTSWAQQVHRLAGAGGEAQPQPVAPWKPPVEDVFQAAARRQAAARPAGLGRRLTARLIDTVVLAGVTAVAAVPLGSKAIDHVNDKIDEAKLSGETVTVWLLDGTTSTYLGIVLAVLLLFGVVYEALPTAKWGRTLGKRLLGLEVRDIEAHEPPSFGAALRRWLVYSVPGLLAVGVVGVAWCLFDRPWHQCWHDKAAGTFVAG